MNMRDSVVQKLNSLFKTHRKSNGDSFTYKEIEQLSGVSASYLFALRAGKRKNPKPSVLRKIASAFNEPITYFEEENIQLQAILSSIKRRSDGMSRSELEVLSGMVDQIFNDLLK